MNRYKLSNYTVELIRDLHFRKEKTTKELSLIYSVSIGTITRIVNKNKKTRSYKHVK